MAGPSSSYTDREICDAIGASARLIGYESVKERQKEALLEFVKGRDVFVCLPTGYGKSICFALLPLIFDRLRGKSGSITLVVSPLTSLMMDQRGRFTHKGLSTDFVGELQQDVASISSIKEGKVQLLYVSPESILSNVQWRFMLQSEVYKQNLNAIAVDEAHCIAKW